MLELPLFSFFFFLNDPPTPEISPLPLHDALPIWIAGAADVVRDPSLRHRDPARLAVNFGFDHARRIRVSGRRPYPRPLVSAGSARRRIRAHRAEIGRAHV